MRSSVRYPLDIYLSQIHRELWSISGITELLPPISRNPDILPSISQSLAEGYPQGRAKSSRCFRPRQVSLTKGNCQDKGADSAHSILGVDALAN